jgi:predicted transcriptional regulator
VDETVDERGDEATVNETLDGKVVEIEDEAADETEEEVVDKIEDDKSEMEVDEMEVETGGRIEEVFPAVRDEGVKV